VAERRPVLLTVSGTIPPDLDEQVAAGMRPRADYRVIAEHTGADVVDVGSALGKGGLLGRLLHRVGGAGLLLGWHLFRRRREYDVLLTDGEQVGIPLALLTRLFGKGGCRHVMIVHVLSVPKKARLIRLARLAGQVDRYIVYCTSQAEFVRNHLGVPAERVVLSTFMVDTEFFSPERVQATKRRMICSAGLERRDYPTLMEAVEGLDVEVVIAAASPWSRQHDSSADRPLPPNVEVRRLSLHELRQLYAEAQFVVMPLQDVDFQAGITTILEAMSMGLPVVCTGTRGQTDTIVQGETGLLVGGGDAQGLRLAVTQLLNDEDVRVGMGARAREAVRISADIRQYAQRVADVVEDSRR
jgi:glycosyltransferase involved in cell wall biosynthesis